MMYGYTYCKNINISQHDELLTDFQVKIELDNTNFDFSKAKSDGSDVKFTTNNGITEIPHWKEEFDSVNETAIIWLKVPIVSNSADTVIQMWYDDASAVDSSDVNGVMEFYEAGRVISGTTNTGKITDISPIGKTVEFSTSGGDTQIHFEDDSSHRTGILANWPTSNNNVYILKTGDWLQIIGESAPNITAKFKMGSISSFYYDVNDVTGSDTYEVGIYGQGITITTNSQQDFTLNWIFIRKYATTEPTVSVGSEITDITIPTITNINIPYVSDIESNFNISITCNDDNKIGKVELYISGLYIDDLNTSDNETFTIDYNISEIGKYSVELKIYDTFGNVTSSEMKYIYILNYGEYYIDDSLNVFINVNIPAESTVNKYLKFEGDYTSDPNFFTTLINSIFNNWTKSVNFNFEYEEDGITIKEGTISKITTIDSKVVDLSFFLNQYTSTEDINLINLSDLVKCRINMGSLVTYVDSVEVDSTELDYTGDLVESEEQSDWAYENIISINPTVETLTDYQLAIELSSFENMKYMNTNLSDIRFTSYDGLTNISYWIESYDYEIQDAKIWIKVPLTSTTENTKIKMKYGNPSAISESNIDNVMLFGDEFSGTELDTDVWLGGYGITQAISNGILTLTSNTNGNTAYYTSFEYNNDLILESHVNLYIDGSRYAAISIGTSDGYEAANFIQSPVSPYQYAKNRHLNISTNVAIDIPNDWFNAKIEVKQGEYTKYYVDDELLTTIDTNVPSGLLSPRLWVDADATSGIIEVNYIFVRQYTETEPTYEIYENMKEWNYNIPITIAATSYVPNDYQLKIELSGNDLYFDKLNENGNDIRFTLDDKKTQLSYWIEELDITNKETTIWVKVPEISDIVDTTLYMYYGNDNAIAKSDGEEVFEFFDDFNTGSLDTNKWQILTSGTRSITNGILSLSTANDIYSYDTVPINSIIESKAKPNSTSTKIMLAELIDYNDSTNYGNNAILYSLGSIKTQSYDGSTLVERSTTGDINWHTYRIDWTDSINKYYIDNVCFDTINTNIHTTDSRIRLNVWQDSGFYDYIFVRKYTDTEPTYTTSNVENLNEWTYYTPITITPTESTTDYQIKIELTTDNFDFTKVNNDGSDIRISQSDKTTQLPYWIESFDKINETAIIWTKVPTLTNGVNTTLYLFSGNINASSIDDGNNVFELFDDFSGTELDVNKWNFNRIFYTGTYSATISDGILEIATGTDTSGALISKQSFTFPFTYTVRHKGAASTSAYFNSIVQSSSGSNSDRVGYAHLGDGTWKTSKRVSDAETIYDSGSSVPTHTNFLNETGKFTDSSMIFYEDDVQINDITTQDRFSSGDNYLQFAVYQSTMYYDFIFVRKYISSEPTVSVGDITVNTLTTSIYNYKLPITIGTSDNVYTDYILPIKLTSSNFDFTKISENFNDLKIMNSDSTIEIPYYLAKADKYNETALIYVKLPSISNVSTTIINLYYNENVTGLHPRRNWESVFGTKIISMYPFSEIESCDDISPFGYNGENNNVSFNSSGAYFDGSSYINLGTNPIFTENFVIMLDYNPSSGSGTQDTIFETEQGTTLYIQRISDIQSKVVLYDTNLTAHPTTINQDANVNSKIIVEYNNGTFKVYSDGILVNTESFTIQDRIEYFTSLGRRTDLSQQFYTGYIKSFKIASSMNYNDRVNFFAIKPVVIFGDEEYIGELNTIVYSNKKYNLKIDLNDGLKLILNGTVIYENNDPLDTMNTITLCDVNESNIKLNRISIYDTITDTTCTFYEKNY